MSLECTRSSNRKTNEIDPESTPALTTPPGLIIVIIRPCALDRVNRAHKVIESVVNHLTGGADLPALLVVSGQVVVGGTGTLVSSSR